MPKCGQLRVGAAWVGGKEPDLLPSGRLRFYDKRCRTRIIVGAAVRGSIAKNSIFRVSPGTGNYGTKRGVKYQQHFKYYKNIGLPGSDLHTVQQVFKQAAAEIPLLPEAEKNKYREMEREWFLKYRNKPGQYKARSWPHFYLAERLPVLYAALP